MASISAKGPNIAACAPTKSVNTVTTVQLTLRRLSGCSLMTCLSSEAISASHRRSTRLRAPCNRGDMTDDAPSAIVKSPASSLSCWRPLDNCPRRWTRKLPDVMVWVRALSSSAAETAFWAMVVMLDSSEATVKPSMMPSCEDGVVLVLASPKGTWFDYLLGHINSGDALDLNEARVRTTKK